MLHLADARLVHHPFLAGVGQQVGQGLGIAVGLLDDMGEKQRRRFHQGAALSQVALGDGAGVLGRQRRNLDLGQLPP